jgi:hypothetical protein
MPFAEQSWRTFVLWLAGGFAGIASAVYLLVLIIDPYGVSPIAPAGARPMLDTNQRFMYPQLIRARQHDSLVIGTSTSRLLEPTRLNAAFGGRFANLALSDGRAWEEYQIADLFLREIGPPKTLLVGLDWVWCAMDADVNRITKRGFPAWMYDDDRWNDLVGIFNSRTLLIVIRRLGLAAGVQELSFDQDGYADFTPGEAAYDPARAAEHVWGQHPHEIPRVTPSYAAATDEAARWRFPALSWLEELLIRTEGRSQVYLVFMPVHVMVQPRPGSHGEAQEAECKRRIQALAERFGATYADHRVSSAVTRDHTNFWDPLHWRIGVGRDLIDDLGGQRRAVATD